MTLDQGRDVAVVRPGQEITFPMARHRPTLPCASAVQWVEMASNAAACDESGEAV
jgi:hypothetical protein